MIKQYLNLEAHGCDHIMFGLPEERTEILNNWLEALETEIAQNHEQYTVVGTEESPGDGLHCGKVLARMLEISQSPQDEIALMFALNVFIDAVLGKINEIMFHKMLLQKTSH